LTGSTAFRSGYLGAIIVCWSMGASWRRRRIFCTPRSFCWEAGRQYDEAVLTFDASTHDQWGLGYAGAVYKGQGRTIDEVFALYDNPFAWNRNGSYVALTRQREDVRMYAAGEAAT
jgi:hypothetical protein